jgi:DNA mismatch endonuclease, patch repair protein
MADVHSKATRSRNMAAIRSRNTKPEKLLRSALHRKGIRFRVHVSALPGRPDLVLAKYNAVIFVNGCFWHGHDCDAFCWPATRKKFWRAKIITNQSRDRRVLEDLRAHGWRCLTIWECTIRRGGMSAVRETAERAHHWLISNSVLGDLAGPRTK